jgi:hypothetical protein
MENELKIYFREYLKMHDNLLRNIKDKTTMGFMINSIIEINGFDFITLLAKDIIIFDKAYNSNVMIRWYYKRKVKNIFKDLQNFKNNYEVKKEYKK